MLRQPFFFCELPSLWELLISGKGSIPSLAFFSAFSWLSSHIKLKIILPRSKWKPRSLEFFLMFIYLLGGGVGRGRENPKQALRCQHRAQRGARTHELWDHNLSRNQEWTLNQLSHQGAPQITGISTETPVKLTPWILKGTILLVECITKNCIVLFLYDGRGAVY